MANMKLGAHEPAIPLSAGASWPLVLGLAILLPALEWGAARLLPRLGLSISTGTLWGATIVADLLFITVLLAFAPSVVRRIWVLPGLKDVAMISGAFVAGWVVIPIVQVAAASLGGTAQSGGNGPEVVPLSGTEVALVAVAAVSGAIAQETLYRGLVWDRLGASGRNEWVALAGSSLIFGTLYASSGVISFLSAGVAWGLVAGLLFKVTRSMTSVVILNALNVFLTYAVLFRFIL